MKNFASICIETSGPVSLRLVEGAGETMDCIAFDIIDGSNAWDNARFFVPSTEEKAIKAAITAFNAAYRNEKKLAQVEAAE